MFLHSIIYPTRCNFKQFIYIWKLLYMFRVVLIWALSGPMHLGLMFRVVPPPIIRSAYNCIYSIWYLSHHYCYLPLSWRNWNSTSSTKAADSSNGVTNTGCCIYAPDDGWRYHPKHVEQFPDINKLCKVVSCWRYSGIYLRCTDP
jgi:hypothetical protein